jgi:ribosome-associated translation inhibitor RaiA
VVVAIMTMITSPSVAISVSGELDPSAAAYVSRQACDLVRSTHRVHSVHGALAIDVADGPAHAVADIVIVLDDGETTEHVESTSAQVAFDMLTARLRHRLEP